MPFTDHHTVILKLGVDVSHSWHGKGYWKLHADLIHDPVCTTTLCREWKWWKHQQRYFPDTTLWWCRLVKRKLKQLYMREGTAKLREAKIMENHYYECIYELLQDNRPPDEKFVTLNRLRGKIINLHCVPLQKILCNTNENNKQPNEQPTLFHVLRLQKRRSTRVIRHIQDETGQIHNSPLAIMRVFMTHFQNYDIIEVDYSCINTMMEIIPQPSDMPYIENVNQPIDIDEIRQAVITRKRQKPQEVMG